MDHDVWRFVTWVERLARWHERRQVLVFLALVVAVMVLTMWGL